MFNKLTDKVSETTSGMMEDLGNMFSPEKLAEKFSNMSDASREKYTKYTNDLISLSPTIEAIGFKTTQITLSMGIPPSFTFQFMKIKDTTQEERDEIMAQHSGNALLKPIVKMLVAADKYQDKIQLGNFRFTTIDVSLGLTPGVNMILTPKD